jgi:hypothetical protein
MAIPSERVQWMAPEVNQLKLAQINSFAKQLFVLSRTLWRDCLI